MGTRNDTFIQACRRQPVDHVPVWYMRQAGRYQKEYQEIRKKYTLLEICKHPEICYEVTKLPVDQLGVDAAILFSDIMVPIGPMGLDFDIKENIGPVIDTPIRGASDVARLQAFDAEESLPYVLETIRLLAKDLTVPLIGFTGAPFTLASYMIEGGPTRTHIKTKTFMSEQPKAWFELMDKLGDMMIPYLTAQVLAGCSAIQLFDTWVGKLAPDDYRTYVFPVMQRIFSSLSELNVPMIYFGLETGELLSMMSEVGANVVGIDWRVPLPTARERVGEHVALQGNLDPAMLFSPWPEIQRRARKIIDDGLEKPGFVFNLGWGVVHNQPTVDPAVLQRLTEFVHEYSREQISLRREAP